MKTRLKAHLFVILCVLNSLLFMFLVLGNLFYFLGWENESLAELVYILRMLWTSMGLSVMLCATVLFGDVKFGTGLFCPFSGVIAFGMLLNVGVDIVELADLWNYDLIGITDFFLSDLLSFFLMVMFTIYTYRYQSESDKIVKAITLCSMEDLVDAAEYVKGCFQCACLKYVELDGQPTAGGSSDTYNNQDDEEEEGGTEDEQMEELELQQKRRLKRKSKKTKNKREERGREIQRKFQGEKYSSSRQQGQRHPQREDQADEEEEEGEGEGDDATSLIRNKDEHRQSEIAAASEKDDGAGVGILSLAT